MAIAAPLKKSATVPIQAIDKQLVQRELIAMLDRVHAGCDINRFSSVHNYYERLVFEVMAEKSLDISDDTYADIACVALNQLPSVYIRHELDMATSHSPRELMAFRLQVHNAVSEAIDFILNKDRRSKPRYVPGG